jgi:hypothetical protein
VDARVRTWDRRICARSLDRNATEADGKKARKNTYLYLAYSIAQQRKKKQRRTDYKESNSKNGFTKEIESGPIFYYKEQHQKKKKKKTKDIIQVESFPIRKYMLLKYYAGAGNRTRVCRVRACR